MKCPICGTKLKAYKGGTEGREEPNPPFESGMYCPGCMRAWTDEEIKEDGKEENN